MLTVLAEGTAKLLADKDPEIILNRWIIGRIRTFADPVNQRVIQCQLDEGHLIHCDADGYCTACGHQESIYSWSDLQENVAIYNMLVASYREDL